MSAINLTLGSSSSVVLPAGATQIQVVEYRNPEMILPPLVQWFLQELDVANIHPNFPTVRIGNTHPFATLLYQSVYGTQVDMSVFPSVTLVDSASSQTAMEVGNGFYRGVLNLTDPVYQQFRSAIDNGQFLTSSRNLSLIDSSMEAFGFVTYTSTRYVTRHTVDCNIWSENKDLTSELYDIVKQYFIDYRNDLGVNHGLHLFEAISGRRSGDINLDFGKLLYGANISVPMNVEHHSYNFSIDDDIISSVDINVTGSPLA